MKLSYWYISRIDKYPTPSWHVMSVQLFRRFTVVEMEREAIEHEVESCDLYYLGCGYWNDEHIQDNYKRYERMINK